MKIPQTVDELFPSKWLKVDDIPEGDDLFLTIKHFEMEEVGQEGDLRPVLYFKETDKGLVLNKTNAKTLSERFGGTIADWMGERIALFATEVSYQGKTSLGIRIRLRQPTRRVTQTEYPEDEI